MFFECTKTDKVQSLSYNHHNQSDTTGTIDLFEGQFGEKAETDLDLKKTKRKKKIGKILQLQSLWFTSVFNLFLHLPSILFRQCQIITTILSMIQYCACW